MKARKKKKIEIVVIIRKEVRYRLKKVVEEKTKYIKREFFLL